MLPFEQVFVASSHFILAFSQAALVVGILSAAKVGATKPTAKPAATIIVISAFMGVAHYAAAADQVRLADAAMRALSGLDREQKAANLDNGLPTEFPSRQSRENLRAIREPKAGNSEPYPNNGSRVCRRACEELGLDWDEGINKRASLAGQGGI
jgi:hypothetical protein